MIDLQKAYPFTNVVNNGVATCDLSSLFGLSVDTIYLRLGGTSFTKSMISSIVLKANGKPILDSTGPAMDARNLFRSLTANAAFLPIDFTEIRARTKLGMQGGSLDTTIGIRNLRLEVTITGATAPTLEAYVAVSAPQGGPEFAALRPLIARVHRVQQTIGAAGDFPLQVPHMDPTSGGSVFKRIHVFSAQMTALKVTRNGITEHESVKAVNDFRQQFEGLRSPQANVYVFDPIVDNLQEGRVFDTRPVSGCTMAQFIGTFANAETITIETEELLPVDAY